VIYTKVGDIYEELGDSNNFVRNYVKFLKISKELAENNPESIEFARDIVVSYYKLDRRDDLQEALLNMKNKNMFMDHLLIHLGRHFELW